MDGLPGARGHRHRLRLSAAAAGRAGVAAAGGRAHRHGHHDAVPAVWRGHLLVGGAERLQPAAAAQRGQGRAGVRSVGAAAGRGDARAEPGAGPVQGGRVPGVQRRD